MVNLKKIPKKWRNRGSIVEIEEERNRTLYVRVPNTIKDANDIRNLFFGNFIVKLPRQSSRYCHVIFSKISEKLENIKAVKKKLINGKPIVIKPPKPLDLQNKKPRQRKLVMPDPTENLEFDKYIFVSNIHDQTSIHEIKQAFPGSVTIGLIQKKVDGPRQARVKIGSSELCSYYVRNQSSWPIFHGKKVTVTYSQKKKSTKKQRQMKNLNMNYHTFSKNVLDVVKDKIKNTDNTELHQQDKKINKKDSDKEKK